MISLIQATLHRTIMAGTSLLLGTTGEILTERSGVLNLGVEGMMSLGAVAGFIVTLHTENPTLGILAALASGALAAFLHAGISVYLKANQTVSGLALSMFGVGLAGVLGKPYIGKQLTARLTPLHIPYLNRIPIVGELLFYQDPLFYAAIGLALVGAGFLKYTRTGIRLRSVGENPKAAETQGVPVQRFRVMATLIGGALAGLAGAHVTLVYSTSWTEGIVGGRGWIIVALTIFSLWNPIRGIVGAFLFGGVFVTQYVLQPLGLPPNLLAMLPYGATLGVLLVDGFRKDRRSLHAPNSLGEPFGA
ncbi:MAG: ABC transporter permease [Spirochaetales bacterium]